MENSENTVPIDDYLKKKVLARLGLNDGDVQVNKETWDLGFCDTCSWPEEGFAVYVNNNIVWPSDEYIGTYGGYIYADKNGRVRDNALSTYGYFFEWLDGEEFGPEHRDN